MEAGTETYPRGITFGGVEDTRLLEGGFTEQPTKPIYELAVETSDEIVPLQGMLVRLPENPMTINGSSYRIAVDGGQLAEAINTKVRRTGDKERYEPRILEICYSGRSLPSQFVDDGEKTRQELDGTVHNYKLNGLTIYTPQEVKDSGLRETDIVTRVEDALNDDLQLGLLENKVLRRKLLRQKLIGRSAILVAAFSGDLTGVITTNGTELERLASGVALGSTSALVVAGFFIMRDRLRHGAYGDTVAPVAQKAYREASRRVQDKKRFFENPVISLVPSESEELTS